MGFGNIIGPLYTPLQTPANIKYGTDTKNTFK